MVSEKEVLAGAWKEILRLLEQGTPVLLWGEGIEGLPGIHNFCPEKYSDTIVHKGWGVFEGRTEHGKFSFTAGSAMSCARAGDKVLLAWTTLEASPEVIKDLGYDMEKAKAVARRKIAEVSG